MWLWLERCLASFHVVDDEADSRIATGRASERGRAASEVTSQSGLEAKEALGVKLREQPFACLVRTLERVESVFLFARKR